MERPSQHTQIGRGPSSASWFLLLLALFLWFSPLAHAQDPPITSIPPPGGVLASVLDTISFRTRTEIPLGRMERMLRLSSRALGSIEPQITKDALDPLLFHLLPTRKSWVAGDRIRVSFFAEEPGLRKSFTWTLGVASQFKVREYATADQVLSLGHPVREARIGDFDGDGISDACVLSEAGLAIFWGLPCANAPLLFRLAEAYVYPIAQLGRNTVLLVGDLDANGGDDILIITDSQPETGMMLLADEPGSRAFRTIRNKLPGTERDPVDAKLLYLDNDEYIDIALLADGNNTFSPMVTDIAGGAPFFTPFGPADGIILSADPLKMVSGDFSFPPDGYTDVAIAMADRTIIFFENERGRQLNVRSTIRTPTSGNLGGMAAADINQDGSFDIVGFDFPPNNVARTYLNTAPDAPFQEHSTGLSLSPLTVRAVDLDGDLFEDAVYHATGRMVAVDRFGAEREIATTLSNGQRGFDLADLNCDGAPDLLAPVGRSAQVRLNRPRPSFVLRDGLIDKTEIFVDTSVCVGDAQPDTFFVIAAFCPMRVDSIEFNDRAQLSGVYSLRLIDHALPADLDPGDSLGVEVVFTPPREGFVPGTPGVVVTGACDVALVALGGTGIQGEVVANEAEIELAPVCPPDSSDGKACFTNLSGQCTRRISDAFLTPSGLDPCMFELVDPPGFPLALAPTESLCVDLRFVPAGRGEYSCTLHLVLEDPADTIQVEVLGRCNNPPFWYSDPVDMTICEGDTFGQQELDYRDPDVGDPIECLGPEWLDGSDRAIEIQWDCDQKRLKATHPGGDYFGWARYRLTIADEFALVSRELLFAVIDTNDPPIFALVGDGAFCGESPPQIEEGLPLYWRLTASDALDHREPPTQSCESSVSWLDLSHIDPRIPAEAIRSGDNPDGSTYFELLWTPGFDAAGAYRINLVACEDTPCMESECNPVPRVLCDSISVCFEVVEVTADLSVELRVPAAPIMLGQEAAFAATLRVGRASWLHEGAEIEATLGDRTLAQWTVPAELSEGDSVLYAETFTPEDYSKNQLVACIRLPAPEVDFDESNNCDTLELALEEGRLRVRPNPFTPNGDGFNDEAVFSTREIEAAAPEVRIFDLSGRELRHLREWVGDRLIWDGRDRRGHRVNAGVYLYIYEDPGRHRSSGEITVAR